MKKLLLLICLIACQQVFASNDATLLEEQNIQSQINKIGTEILNANKITNRVIFAYDSSDKKTILKDNQSLTKRQIVIYKDVYKNLETKDELAGYIAREIPKAARSYQGIGNGFLSSIKLKAAPKKYELVFDKLAVDYMVKAGYNPIGLIIHINKSYPQARQDKISSHNLTSKRLAYIYERIYRK